MTIPWRPQQALDYYKRFVAPNDIVPVSLVNDLRGLSSREPAPFASVGSVQGNPGAGNHWCFTFTPRIPSKECKLRFCWASFLRETSSALVGTRIGVATAKAASNPVVQLGDVTGVVVTADEITNANLPALSVYTFFADAFGVNSFWPMTVYPKYVFEVTIPPNNVWEMMSRTQDDALSMSTGFYTLPIV